MQSNFLGWLKKFGPSQNILGPVKRQGISTIDVNMEVSNRVDLIKFACQIKLHVHFFVT